MTGCDIDLAIVGGGLAGGLIALALAEARPDLRLLLIEAAPRFGGNHLWSFFATDVAPVDAWLVEPLIEARWDGYDVRFPSYARCLATPYRTASSERLDGALRRALPDTSRLAGTAVHGIGREHVMLADGTRIAARAVIDARGGAALTGMAGGWQVFLGRMLHLDAPHGLSRPVVMDATVEQLGGYRFVYCLPFAPDRVFVEDTYYADTPILAADSLRARIADYAAAQGWRIAAVEREETGVLPVIANGDFDAFWPDDAGEAARAGTRAALVHPLTSYSLPDAVRLASLIAGLHNLSGRDLSGEAIATRTRAWARAHWQAGRFYRLLSTMLFGAAAPEQRARVLERFYTLSPALIERFYAGRSTPADKLRILAGRPPVPVLAALASIVGHGRALAPLGPPGMVGA